MILVEKNEGFELTFHSTHTHAIKIRHVDLAQKKCETIAGMMKSGFLNDYILNFFKTKPSDHCDHWVDEKELRQIAKRFHLGDEWRSHNDDAKSVYLFVEQNRHVVSFFQPEVKEEGKIIQVFVLVWQTEKQVKYV